MLVVSYISFLIQTVLAGYPAGRFQAFLSQKVCMKGLYRHGISADSGSGKKDQDVLKKDSSLWLDVWKCAFFC